MGLHGASTCPVTLDGVVVPEDALLGEAGKGHRIAFNVLNVGRFKLGAACMGGTATDARDRHALRVGPDRVRGDGWPTSTSSVPSWRPSPRARMPGRASTHRRAARGEPAAAEDATSPHAIRAALEEYAVECSIAKVMASEELGYAVDELVQIHGGYGYIEEYPAAGYYRDARIHRIWRDE